MAEKQARKTIVTAPKPIQKRRGTMTEAEFHKRKSSNSGVHNGDGLEKGFNKRSKVDKNDRAEKLRELVQKRKEQREANGEFSSEPPRKTFKPKVKNTTISRASLLSSDMLLSDPK